MKKSIIAILTSLALAPAAFAAGGGHKEITDYDWSFEGPFGSYDQHQLQRGLQVYTEVCAACHGLQYVSFESLTDKHGPAIPRDQVEAYVKNFEVFDENSRELVTAKFADRFPRNTGAGAPDLSLMAKARAGFHGPYGLGINQIIKGMGGPEYIYSVLTGYTGHEIEEAGAVFYENKAFSGNKISMAPPLSEGLIAYQDGSPETVEQYSADVTAFLMWAAEPKLNDRKMMGMVAFIMLAMTAIILWFANKALWYDVKHRKED